MEKENLWARKAALRPLAVRRRDAQTNTEALSERICATVRTLPEYQRVETICSYVGVGNEVLTWNFLDVATAGGKKIVVPYVSEGRLALFRLADLAELGPAPFGLLEPRRELRDRPARQIEAHDVDLFVVPGLAFDTAGTRLGHGKGYYDKLLRLARVETPRVGLAFACQMLPRLPALAYDISMHAVVTEIAVHRPDASGRHVAP